MVSVQIQRFVLDDCLEKLRQRLLQSSTTASSLSRFNLRLQSSVKLEDLQWIWMQVLREDQRLAEIVEAEISVVLERVHVQPEVVEQMRRLQFVAGKAAFGIGRECEDLTLSDTETTQTHTLLSDEQRPLAHFPSSCLANVDSPSTPLSGNSASTMSVPKSSETPLSLLYCAASLKRHPKLESFRLKLIRGMMRSIRDFTKRERSYSKSGPHVIDINDTEQVQRYDDLRELFCTNRADLEPYGRTESGPETNKWRQKGNSQPNSTRPASYNDDFCRQFFANESLSDYFQAYLSVVFSGSDPELCCQRLKVRCCAQARHSPICQEVWKQVQGFARWGMLERLGLDSSQRYLTDLIVRD